MNEFDADGMSHAARIKCDLNHVPAARKRNKALVITSYWRIDNPFHGWRNTSKEILSD